MNIPTQKERKPHGTRFSMPDIPRDMWCDFRIDFVENKMTLVELAAKYYCDPRTVRSCIQHNKSSFELGRKSTPTRIQVYESPIRRFLTENIADFPENVTSVYSLSRYLYPILLKEGYTGSERTLRNHLQNQPYVKAILERRQLQSKDQPTRKNEPVSGSEMENL